MTIDRRQFLERVGGGTALLFLAGCGGGAGGYGGSAAPAPAQNQCGAVTITGNHGHSLVIPVADLDSMVDKTYNIQGAAVHNHVVTLALADLRALKAGTAVTVISSNAAGHEHSISILCV